MGSTLLVSIQDLHVRFHTHAGIVHALNGIDLEICKKEILGLVGETGCGKSITGLSLMRLIPEGGEVVAGTILLDGEELLNKPESEMEEIRGSRVAMIFQDPGASLNPLFTVGQQMQMVMQRHERLQRKEMGAKALEMLRMVELPDPSRMVRTYPHELSGGMKQRVSIAIALSCGAELLIADEPTTDLDVTVQAQVLDLLRRLRDTQDVTILMITHDLAVVAELCDRVAVLYAGQVVEAGSVDIVLRQPKHPYTQALLQASPRRDSRGTALQAIPGAVPSGLQPLQGCSFSPRCLLVRQICAERPPRISVGAAHAVACFLYAGSEAT